MTEVQQDSGTAVAEAPAVDREKVLASLDAFDRMAVEKMDAIASEVNPLITAAAKKRDKQTILDDLRESSKRKEVVTLRAQISELAEKLYALETQRDEFLTPEVEKVFASQSETVDTTRIEKLTDAYRKLLGVLSNESAREIVTPLVRKRGVSSAAGTTGIKRPRVSEVFVDGKVALQGSGDDKRSTLSAATALINSLHKDDEGFTPVATDALQRAFFTAAGTEIAAEFPPETKFDFAGHTILVTKRAEA